MALDSTNNYEDWIPEERDGVVLRALNETSWIESNARKYPMRSDTVSIPRSHGLDVSGVYKATNYDFAETNVDTVVLVARKFGDIIPFNEEDLDDSYLNPMEQARLDWIRGYAVGLDNACLGVTADANSKERPFVSLYKALHTSDSTTSYTAEANVVTSASAGAVSYDDISEVLGIYEQSEYFDEARTKIVAHPSFKAQLRNIKDNEDRPIFVQGQGGDSGTPSTLFGYPIEFTHGAKTSDSMTSRPTGKALLYVVNTDFVALGVRSGPESQVSGANEGLGFVSDQAMIKIRSRRAFALTHPNAAALLKVQ